MIIPDNLNDYKNPSVVISQLINRDRKEKELIELYQGFNVTSFASKTLELKLNFSDPIEISSD